MPRQVQETRKGIHLIQGSLKFWSDNECTLFLPSPRQRCVPRGILSRWSFFFFSNVLASPFFFTPLAFHLSVDPRSSHFLKDHHSKCDPLLNNARIVLMPEKGTQCRYNIQWILNVILQRDFSTLRSKIPKLRRVCKAHNWDAKEASGEEGLFLGFALTVGDALRYTWVCRYR